MTDHDPNTDEASDQTLPEEPENSDGGMFDPGEDGEDEDVLGTAQEDLTAEDLKGDTRSGQA